MNCCDRLWPMRSSMPKRTKSSPMVTSASSATGVSLSLQELAASLDQEQVYTWCQRGAQCGLVQQLHGWKMAGLLMFSLNTVRWRWGMLMRNGLIGLPMASAFEQGLEHRWFCSWATSQEAKSPPSKVNCSGKVNTFYSGFTNWKLWFSIVILVYQRVHILHLGNKTTDAWAFASWTPVPTSSGKPLKGEFCNCGNMLKCSSASLETV